jgi:hypothetical protein
MFFYNGLVYYSLQYNCDKGEKPDFPLTSVPTVGRYEKYGTFITPYFSLGDTVGIVGR